jgi:hypothetical protein
MLPWASFPKRFPTDIRFAPRNVALDAPRTSCFQVPAHEARTRSSLPPGGASSPSRCVDPSVVPFLDDRATLRCDVPLRVALRCTVSRRAEAHPVTETVQQVPSGRLPGQIAPPVRLSFWTSTIWPSAAGFNRQFLSAGALWFRTSPQCEMPLDSAIPWATPRRESHILSGKPARARSSRYGTHPVPLSPPASLPSGSRCSPREHTRIHTVPRAHSRVRLWNRAPPSAKHASIGAAPSGAGLLATAGPFTRFPRRRNAVVHGFPDWQYEPGRSPVSGQQPWSSVPGMHTLRSYLFLNTGAPRIRRFLETRPLGRSPCSASITFHAEASRDLRLPFGKALEECRTQRVQYSGDCLRRHVETFWFGLSLRATTLGPGHRV